MVKVSGTRSYSAMQILTWSVLEFQNIIQPVGLTPLLGLSYDKVANIKSLAENLLNRTSYVCSINRDSWRKDEILSMKYQKIYKMFLVLGLGSQALHTTPVGTLPSICAWLDVKHNLSITLNNDPRQSHFDVGKRELAGVIDGVSSQLTMVDLSHFCLIGSQNSSSL